MANDPPFITRHYHLAESGRFQRSPAVLLDPPSHPVRIGERHWHWRTCDGGRCISTAAPRTYCAAPGTCYVHGWRRFAL